MHIHEHAGQSYVSCCRLRHIAVTVAMFTVLTCFVLILDPLGGGGGGEGEGGERERVFPTLSFAILLNIIHCY